MGKQLKVHKVNSLPSTIEPDSLYIYKDPDGHLLLSQTDNQGVVAFTTMSSNDVYGLIDQKLADSPVVSGARSLNLGQLATYTIINYNTNIEYTVTALSGTVSIENDTITYQAPASGKVAGFIVNTTIIDITLANPSFINKPSITIPEDDAIEVSQNFLIESSPFMATGETDVHLSSDWQISTDPMFSSLLLFTNNNTNAKVAWNATVLPVNTQLYVRVRHKGVNLGLSEWSETSSFTTKKTFIAKPEFQNLVDEQTGIGETFLIETKNFSKIAGSGTHLSTDWRIATDENFSSPVVNSLNDTVNLTSYNLSGLSTGTTYYVSVRFKASTDSYSDWTNVISFSTKSTFDTKAAKPTITNPSDLETDVGPDLTITSSTLHVSTGTVAHASTDWQIATDESFTSIYYQSTNDTSNKTSLNLTNLPVNDTFYVRVRYTGLGLQVSDWSDTITFTTKQSYSADPNTPYITSPLNGATGILPEHNFTSSEFAVGSGVDLHASTDWQIASDSDFSTIVKESLDDEINKVEWLPGDLPVNSTLYIRVKYHGAYTGDSAWSTTISFSTAATYITTPIITSPDNEAVNQSDTVSVTSSAFDSVYVSDTHTNSDWQLSTVSNFASIVSESLNDTTNKTSWSVNNLTEGTTYYLRTRRRSANGGVSAWSSTVSFSTYAKYINAPSITSPSNGTNNLTPYVAFASNTFSTNVAGQTHASSDWQVATDSGFSTIVKSVTDDTGNKTAWTIADGLPSNTAYYARVRYKSNSGYISNWSTTIILSTKAYYVATPTITSPTGGATNLGLTVTITTGAFSSDVTGETHTSTDWQLSTVSNFSSIAFQSLDNTTNKTSWTSPNLEPATTYYARVRFKGSSSL